MNQMTSPPTRSNPQRHELPEWDGPNDPANPRNWTSRRKWTTLLTVSGSTLLSPLSSTMIAPAASIIGAHLLIDEVFVVQLCLSVFLLGLGFAPLLLSPLSEAYGRYPILLVGNIFYLIWTIACGCAASQAQLISFRLLSGIGASAPIAVGGGIIGDLWPPETRAKVLAIYTCGPLLGPALGPVAGGFIVQQISWRWIFWCFSIVDVCFFIAALCLVRETYAPRLLYLKGRRELASSDEDGSVSSSILEVFKNHKPLSLRDVARPLYMMSQSVVQLLCVYMAVLYGIMFLLLFNFPLLWTQNYMEEDGVASLNYISIGLGYVIGSQAAAALNDAGYRYLKKRNNGVDAPEYRIPVMVPASLVIPLGLLLFAWAGQYRLHWIVPNIGSFLFSAGFIVCFQVIQTYTIDTYAQYAASALATQNLSRSLTGFGFPLFAPYLYEALGIGWGNSVLALILLLAGAVMPYSLWRYGPRLRGGNASVPSPKA